MALNGIPRRVSEFILDHIENVTSLEIICRMHTEPAKAWTSAELASALRSSTTSISQKLNDLQKRGILVAGSGPGTVQLNLSRGQLTEILPEVCAAFRTFQSRMIELIYSDRRDRSIRNFANAFVFGSSSPKDDEDSGDHS